MSLFIYLLLSCSATIVLGLECKGTFGEHSKCACTMDDGSGTVDISSYAKQDKTPGLKGNNGDYTYYYNPCYPMNVDGVQGCSDDTAAGCQVASNGVDGYKTGAFDQVTFSVDSGGTNNVIITYEGGFDGRQMKVSLICNPLKSDTEFKALGEPNQALHYEFTLESKCACPLKEGDLCTTGGGGENSNSSKKNNKSDPGVVGIVLLCVALVAFVSYFVIGAIVLRMRYQKSGTDLIINKAFWKDFPILVKDGFVLTFSPCYNLIKNRKGGYSNI